MPTSADRPLAPVRSSAGVAAPVADAVADDLQAIFPNAVPRASAARLSVRLAGEGRGRRRAQGRVAAIGAMAAAALFGLAAGALIGRGPGAPAASPTAPGQQVRIVMASRPEVIRAHGPRPPEDRTAPAQQLGLPSPGPLSAPQLAPAVAVAEAAPAPLVTMKAATVRKARAARSARRKPAAAAPARCRGACGYDDVMAADARLRRAYAAAVKSGVPRPVVVGYRNEWASLRRRAPEQPKRIVVRYNEMARDLERYADRPHAARAPSSKWRSATVDGLRADLASLWP